LPGVGEVLRSRREALGLTLEQVYAQLRIPVRSLRAIEEERFDLFDSPQYAKGFVRSYAELLGLEPEPLVAEVGRVLGGRGRPQLVAPSGEVPIRPAAPPPRWKRWLAWGGLAVAVGVLTVAYVGYQQLRAFYTATPPPEEQSAPQVGPVPERPPKPAATPRFPVAMAGEPTVRLVLTAEDVSWLRVVADGRRVFEGFIRTGERREWEAHDTLSVVIGNAGGVRVRVNDEDLGILGAPGEVVRRTFSASR
jgi:hypothetical protein